MRFRGADSRFTDQCRGFTLSEMLVVTALLGALTVALTPFLTRILRANLAASLEAESIGDLQTTLSELERDFEEMTLVSSATANFIQFQGDYNHHPNFNMGAVDPNGVPFRLSPDWDGDMTGPGGIPVVATDFNGHNLWDQDDDNDGNIDVQCRYYVDSHNDLIRELNFNEAGWILKKTMLRGVMKPLFAYWGSINHIPGRDADANSDGLVTMAEIDNNPAAGNGNGWLDLPSELLYIDSIQISLRQDRNADGKTDFKTEQRIRPPLLSSNRRV